MKMRSHWCRPWRVLAFRRGDGCLFTFALMLIVAVGVNACSSGAGSDTMTSTTPARSAVQVALSSLPPAQPDDCGGAVGRIRKAVTGYPQVSGIVMIAACGEVSVQTVLPPGVLGSSSATTGIKICTAAATVAYQGKVGSVTVVAEDGSELAIGLKGSDCIP